jgi:geranylgeranyl pyrophosphate synthase
MLRLRPRAADLSRLEDLRRAVLDSGAAAEAEDKIRDLAAEALAGLAKMPVSPARRQELSDLTQQMVWRTS